MHAGSGYGSYPGPGTSYLFLCRSALQVFKQGFNAGSLGLYQPEVGNAIGKIFQDISTALTAGFVDKFLYDVAQVVAVRLHVFGSDSLYVNILVDAVSKGVLLIKNISKASGHGSAEIDAGIPQHGYVATRHVLAAMIADTFDYRVATGITYCKAFTGQSGRKQFATCYTIKAGVADYGCFMTFEN